MKKIFFMALMAVMSISASAQIEQGLRFGVQGFGGINSIGEDGAKNSSYLWSRCCCRVQFLGEFLSWFWIEFSEQGLEG